MTGPRRLRIHALIDSLRPGGAEMLMGEFALGARLAGIDFSVGYLHGDEGPPAARLEQLGVPLERVPITSLVSIRDLRRVRAHLARVGPDLVHTHLGYSDFLGGIAARSLGLPAVSTLHVMEWDREFRERVKLLLMAFTRIVCCQRTICVSDAARESYLGAWPARPSRVVTVHNGVAAPVRPGSGRAVRAELGIPAEAPLISMITVLREGKGHGVAIEAMGAVRKTSPHARLLVLGDGPARDEVRAASARLPGSIVLAGHRNEVMDVLDATDVLLHPSRVDAFPTALLEAMAARVPIVASRVGGIPEIVEHRRQGLLIDAPPSAGAAAEALVELLGDSGLRRSLGVAGRRRFEEHFTAEAWMQRLLPVYEAALAAGPRRRRQRAAGGLPSTEEAAP